jgi:hypothetical protein
MTTEATATVGVFRVVRQLARLRGRGLIAWTGTWREVKVSGGV